MKPFPNENFPVNVRSEQLEVGSDVAAWYQDIYTVTLNFSITVMVIPPFLQSDGSWPVRIPDNIDIIHSELEARVVAAAFAKYVITAKTHQTDDCVLLAQGIDGDGIVFFLVQSDELFRFVDELHSISEELSGIYDYRVIRDLKYLSFFQYLLSRVIASDYFNSADYVLLNSPNNL